MSEAAKGVRNINNVFGHAKEYWAAYLLLGALLSAMAAVVRVYDQVQQIPAIKQDVYDIKIILARQTEINDSLKRMVSRREGR